MANGPLPHFVGPEVLNSVFQQLVAHRIPLGKAMREIMEALQGGDLCLSVYVAGSVRALQPMHFATKEEEEQAREEYRAAVAKYDYDAAEDAIYGTSPAGGIIGPLGPGDWGHKVTLVIRDRHLLIKWLDPTFPPEFYKFAIINPEAVDKLLAAASPVQEQSKSPPAPPDPEKWLISVQAEFTQVSRKQRSAWVRDTAYPRIERELGGKAPWKDWKSLKRAMYPGRRKKI
jgi:hypothetical protein